MCYQLLLKLLDLILTFNSLLRDLLQLNFCLRLKPSKCLHISLRRFQMPPNRGHLLIFLPVQELSLPHLILQLLVFRSQLMLDEQLRLEILVDLLQLLLQHLVLLQELPLVHIDLVYNPRVHLVLLFILLECLLLLLEVLLCSAIELSLESEVFLQLLNLAIVIQSLLVSRNDVIVLVL